MIIRKMFFIIAFSICICSLLLSQETIRVVDKDRPNWGIKSEFIVIKTGDVIATTDEDGYLIGSVDCVNLQRIRVRPEGGYGYYSKYFYCPITEEVIKLQAVQVVSNLAMNAFSLANINDTSAALAFAELAMRTEEIDPKYSIKMRNNSYEVAVKTILKETSFNDIKNTLAIHGFNIETLKNEERIYNDWGLFLNENRVDNSYIINQVFSNLIAKYQEKKNLTDFSEGQLDYSTLRSFSNYSSGDLLFNVFYNKDVNNLRVELPNIESIKIE